MSIFEYNIQSIDLNPILQYAYYLKDSEFGMVGKKSSVNGFQTNEMYDMDLIVKPLFNNISDIVNTNCKELASNIKLNLGYYWININGNGSYNEKHHHMGNSANGKRQSIVSGVFYLNVPDGDSGNIVFAQNNKESISIKPKTGDLLLFSPSLIHNVEINNTMEDRISIAFNFIKDSNFKINNIF
jgi:hypothetical protein